MTNWLIGILTLVISGGAVFYKGVQVGKEIEIAHLKKIDDATQSVKKDAMDGAAAAIAKLEIKHETIIKPLRTEVVTQTEYRDCHHTPDGLRALNDALTNGDGSEPVDSGQLPKVDSAVGR